MEGAESVENTVEKQEERETASTPHTEESITQPAGGVLDAGNVFAEEYTPTKPIAQPLPILPENDPVETFDTPSIQVSLDASSPVESSASSVAAVATPGDSTPAVHGLSPMLSHSPNHHRRRSSTSGHRRKSSTKSSTGLGLGITNTPQLQHRSSIASNGSVGDFEDFQEGDGGSDFGDFDDFEEGNFSDNEEETSPISVPDMSSQKQTTILLPNIEDEDEVRRHTHKLLDHLLPEADKEGDQSFKGVDNEAQSEAQMDTTVESDEEDDSPFMLTDRAVSLWKQLTAPPPLQPPDWKRSRIRRLFLVSLGIPVDLDEILPKMTHKKLVLPSTKRHKDKKSSEYRRSRKKIPPPPEFEVTTARRICTTTREALASMTVRERDMHIATLKAHTTAASDLLTYWLEQREVAQSEKDTFEQVVSNLVQYHKKQKDEQKETATKVSKKSRSRFSMRG